MTESIDITPENAMEAAESASWHMDSAMNSTKQLCDTKLINEFLYLNKYLQDSVDIEMLCAMSCCLIEMRARGLSTEPSIYVFVEV